MLYKKIYLFDTVYLNLHICIWVYFILVYYLKITLRFVVKVSTLLLYMQKSIDFWIKLIDCVNDLEYNTFHVSQICLMYRMSRMKQISRMSQLNRMSQMSMNRKSEMRWISWMSRMSQLNQISRMSQMSRMSCMIQISRMNQMSRIIQVTRLSCMI